MIAASCANPQAEIVQRVCQFIQASENNPTLAQMGAHVNLSPFHLQRVFKRVMGISPREYAEAVRLKRLKSMLRGGDSVTGAMYDAGYSSSSRLYERSSTHLGMTPATYRRGGEGMDIAYVIVDCPLGRLLVAATRRGVCAIHVGDNDAHLENTLFDEYPLAHFERNRFQFCDWVHVILEHLNGWRPHLELPIDVQATAFQLRVWNALRDIPYGETRTYRDVAAAIGLPPAAAGVVARAIDENPLTIFFPCHRTERADGEVSALYSERGRTTRGVLIENERRLAEAPSDTAE